MTGVDWLIERGPTIWLQLGTAFRLSPADARLACGGARRRDTPLGGPDRGCQYRPPTGNRDSILRDGIDLQFGEPAIRDKGGPLTGCTGAHPMRGLAVIVAHANEHGGLT